MAVIHIEVSANIPFRLITDSFVSTEVSPLTKPPRIHTQDQQATGPRESVSETSGSAIPSDILPQIQRIAGPDRISPSWHYVRAQRTLLPATGADQKPTTAGPTDTSEDRIGRLLSRSQMQYEAASDDDVYFPGFHRRLYLANISSLYNQETMTLSTPGQRFTEKLKNRTAPLPTPDSREHRAAGCNTDPEQRQLQLLDTSPTTTSSSKQPLKYNYVMRSTCNRIWLRPKSTDTRKRSLDCAKRFTSWRPWFYN